MPYHRVSVTQERPAYLPQGIEAPRGGVFFSSEPPGTGTWRISGSSNFSRLGSCGFFPGFIVRPIRGLTTKTRSDALLLKLVLLKRAPKIGTSPKNGNFVRSLTTL